MTSNWKPAVGIWASTPNPWLCEIAAAVGFDAVVIDGEHGTFGPQALDTMVLVARAKGLRVAARVFADRLPIQQALDAGADTLILPQIEDLAHARRVAAYAKYPPLGSRGMGAPRSLNYGDPPADFVAAENRRTRCLVMIETPGALKDVVGILALPTVDGVFLGPYDLSLTRGRGAYAATPEDAADARAVADAARRADKLLAMPAGDARNKRFAEELGAGFVTVGDDLGALGVGLRTALALVR